MQKLSSSLTSSDTTFVVILEGGPSTTRHCSDHEPLFRQESYFHWTFGVEEPDFFGCINVKTGKSVLFAPKLPAEYAVWMGRLWTKQEIRDRYAVDEVVWSTDMKDYLKSLGSNLTLLTLKGLNSDSGKESKEASFEGIKDFSVRSDVLHAIISELRVFKTEAELEVIRYACKVSSEAHVQVMKKVRAGMKEYQLESIFQHHCYFTGRLPFDCYSTRLLTICCF